MPKGSITKETRNYRYSRLRRLGATRKESKEGMDFRQLRFDYTIAGLSVGLCFARAKVL